MLEKFLNLPLEKQNKIIDAALICFGNNGYKKASVSDIAAVAGISKAMVFHYFETKKNLYLYLFEICGNILMETMNKTLDKDVSDSFLRSVYYEQDNEVAAEVKAIFLKGEGVRNDIALTGSDIGKFKDGVEPRLVVKTLTWISEGYISEIPGSASFDFDSMGKAFEECLILLKNNLYKEEYL